MKQQTERWGAYWLNSASGIDASITRPLCSQGQPVLVAFRGEERTNRGEGYSDSETAPQILTLYISETSSRRSEFRTIISSFASFGMYSK